MIKAEHKKWAKLIFDPYINYLLHKNFDAFYVTGSIPDLRKYPELIITPNHFSWWDGFITYHLLSKITPKIVYTMMLEDQLKKYWFFKNVGAFSINQSNPVSIVRTLEYTREILENKENIVVLYPQGEIQSLLSEDIIIKPGLKILLEKNGSGKYVLPLALKIEYGKNKRPYIAAEFGRIFSAEEINKDYEGFTKEFKVNIRHLKDFNEFERCRKLF